MNESCFVLLISANAFLDVSCKYVGVVRCSLSTCLM